MRKKRIVPFAVLALDAGGTKCEAVLLGGGGTVTSLKSEELSYAEDCDA